METKHTTDTLKTMRGKYKGGDGEPPSLTQPKKQWNFHKCSDCYYYRQYKIDLSYACKLIHFRSKPGESKYCYHDQPCKEFKPKSK